MAGFIAGLYMKEHKIRPVAQCLQRGLRLPFIISVGETCGTIHMYGFQSGIQAKPSDYIYSSNHTSMPYAIHLPQSGHGRLVAGTPRPYEVGRVLALSHSPQIHRMLRQYFLRP